MWAQVILLWQLLSLQERLNTNPSYMQTGPLAEFLWASSIFHSGKMKISHPYNRLIGLKWHFIMLSIFLKTVMLRLAGSATEFWAGNKVLGSFTSLTQSLQQEGLYLLCKTQRSISHDFKGHIHLSAYLKACVPHRCCLLTFLHSHQLFISSLQLIDNQWRQRVL